MNQRYNIYKKDIESASETIISSHAWIHVPQPSHLAGQKSVNAQLLEEKHWEDFEQKRK